MRDPVGRVEITQDAVLRHAYAPLSTSHFLDTDGAQTLIRERLLTPFQFESRSLLKARKVAFVSYPWEWTHGQFIDAASTTLDVAEEALRHGHELKDASAFNVLFNARQAEFCDHFSFQPILRREWWAYGQFVRHFLLPLAASKHAGQEAASVFKANLDGLPVGQARMLLGTRRFFHRIGLALLQGDAKTRAPVNIASTHGITLPQSTVKPLHGGVIQFLRWQLSGLKRPLLPSTWVDYEATRTHYTDQAVSQKRNAVDRWIRQVRPGWVADLGCNQGEFSLLAAEVAKGVIAVDADYSSIEGLQARLETRHNIHTVCAMLDDLDAGRGWLGGEYKGLIPRIHECADLVMALALTHHLAIGRGVPLPEVAKLMSACTRRYLIVEMIEPQDPMIQDLLANRSRTDSASFSLDAQRSAFAAHFRCLEEIILAGSARRLALMEKHEPS
jgi:SAM-dependent methyltransferase